jgi:hypothetical protein
MPIRLSPMTTRFRSASEWDDLNFVRALVHDLRHCGGKLANASDANRKVAGKAAGELAVLALNAADCISYLSVTILALGKERENYKAAVQATGAAAVVRGGKIEISIDIDALPQIVSGSCCCDSMDGLWKVTDPAVFAKAVCHALNNEEEDGTTRVHTMFDGAFMCAIEQGAEGIEEVSEEAFEAEADRLQSQAQRSTGSPDGR